MDYTAPKQLAKPAEVFTLDQMLERFIRIESPDSVQDQIRKSECGDMSYLNPAKWHPAANLFPLITGSEFDALVNSIADHGLQNPVILHEGKVLDGRNRLRACHQAGREPTFVPWFSGGLSPVDWVIVQNLDRRHLDAGQRAAIAVDAKPLLEGEAKERQRLSPGRPNVEGEKRSVKNDLPLPQVRTQVAKQFDVSEGYVHAAQKIKDTCPQTFEDIKAGVISIPEAQRQLGMKQTVKNVLSSDSNEWYTPTECVEAARTVMGTIDLDPASNDRANAEVVKATLYYTEETDGLAHTWGGRVWLNPPYADIGPKFVAKLIEEYNAFNVKEAILLVNPRTDTAWFQPLFDFTLCFTSGRIKFWKTDGSAESPTTGSVFVYLGPNRDRFAEVFSQFGAVVSRYA